MPEIKLAGIAIPVGRKAAGAIGVVAVLGLAGLLYRQIFPEERGLLTALQANHMLSMEVQEYNLHIMEAPQREEVLFDDARGTLKARLYGDNCLLLQRTNGQKVTTKLLPDLLRADLQHKDGDEVRFKSALAFVPIVEAAGQCLNPHPPDPYPLPPFQTRYGRKINACVVEIWRLWADGCTHYQLFDACNGTWDTLPNGTPRVYWASCRH